ncbi:DHH family phosphoesterase [Companilactobacillus sp.]|jgi:phosphoesterase RecJ-like protein|uniref:DHH family phosphoesterase n=1 Tax=Companilactobacillus sp. TaxID=2767905 RepID=UPI0025C40798|nr:bifunctional oligoribonuclease/PAP phosphatase NrnA [Companilactobacillus sp.]MCH4007922.1 bifunctional oligoribonuclease/PAP phosphatase NrnA [Companilactobacillus sp.]MCH4051899.1 bifunctional oligoribonuclease/PAP phosphatase NrnA [Companilactobacillus sp.]MCH4075865.1 bifunctional oligoribonuclease/PAP phosphatase NrnA [Companilactobacillus sp.]MCH4124440.1 bifunctional oligoribonuclease/PAP phosphatase NrnA [Companilactobacillus sp.]MCH4132597.1 bifunctional oligoribonuclease/PAP phosp
MNNEILTEIKNNQTIIIARHKNPDPDAIGSEIGLKLAIQAAYPDKKVFAVGSDIPILNWIGKMEHLDQALYKDALIIVVDTANTIRIDDPNNYQAAKKIIKIDHHPDVDDYGDISWVDTTYSSCSEMIFELIDSAPELNLTKEIAEKLYAGIIGDTNRFLYADTNARSLAIAAKLADTGIDLSAIGHKEDGMSLDVARLEAYILENFTLLDSGFAYVLIDKMTLDIFNLRPGEIDNVVPLIGTITDVRTWAVISEKEQDRFRVNLRSKDIAINPVAERFGGGGHPLASGVFLHSHDEVDRLVTAMDELSAQ